MIEWSDEDQAYLVTLPEWAGEVMMPATHGDTYAEAAANGQQILDLLVTSAREEGRPLPAPRVFGRTA